MTVMKNTMEAYKIARFLNYMLYCSNNMKYCWEDCLTLLIINKNLQVNWLEMNYSEKGDDEKCM